MPERNTNDNGKKTNIVNLTAQWIFLIYKEIIMTSELRKRQDNNAPCCVFEPEI